MSFSNKDVATAFEAIADLLEIDDANPFRVRAYRNASRTMENLEDEASSMIDQGRDLTEVPGIGKELAAKIETIVETGTVKALEELQQKIPAGVVAMLRLPGLGPKKVKTLYRDLGVTSLEQLDTAAAEGKVRALPGMGAKTEEQIRKGIAARIATGDRILHAAARPVVDEIIAILQVAEPRAKLSVAGSYRRCRDTVGDLDILAVSKKPDVLMETFVAMDGVADIQANGDTKSSVRLRSGLQVDLRVVASESYGAALHYFTGSQAHNVAVRRRAQKMGLKLNEYGLYRGDEQIAGATEKEVFAALDLAYIEPELREDAGEIDVADEGSFPKLVTQKDIKGDLHSHSRASDGRNSIREMAEAARDRGYAYLAMTDHSKRLTVANGLDERRIEAQIEEIDEVNGTLEGFTILKGIETDILDDGTLDISDDVLARLDIVVASVHHRFNLSREQQTERVMRAMDNPYFNVLGHPTGRILLEREPYEIDIPRIIAHAAERGCCLELNANPLRLDLHEKFCRQAMEQGVLISVSTDAHAIRNFDYIVHGIGQARRGWLEKKHVLNTRTHAQLRKLLRAMRA